MMLCLFAAVTLLQCYWFYRPSEVPETAWDMPNEPKRREVKGARFAWSKGSKGQQEKRSERQVGIWSMCVYVHVSQTGNRAALSAIIDKYGEHS